MASNHGVIQRPGIVSTPTKPADSEDSIGKKPYDSERPEFKLVCPFSIPSSPEAASLRIIKNLGHFALHYTHFVWIVLFITLIPVRKVSLIYLVIMTYVASLYLLLLRALPSSYLLHKVISKNIVLGLIVIATMVELIVTEAGLHLVITLAATIPIVLVHAVLWVREDFCVEDGTAAAAAAGDLVPLADESTAMV
ncbi:unnamed protein product [Dovyalis caffra]|uniref:PRA1 family protein n=1 Tax=Dovyalis caffra TaxID=77055 RepID=A0AAV1QMC8_9ROSI|nr:unnamed protein product [Dovyalis caffra]